MTACLFISTSPFQIPAVVQPSPRATVTTSGIRPRICSAISRPQVFFPSTRYGLIAQLRLYQPKRRNRGLARPERVLVRTFDEEHPGPVHEELGDLRLRRGNGHEDERLHPRLGREAGQRGSRVAGRRAGDLLPAEPPRARDAHGARAVLERGRGVAAVVLDEEGAEAELLSERRRLDHGREAHLEARRDDVVGKGQESPVAPERQVAVGLESRGAEGPRDELVVVFDVEDSLDPAPRAGVLLLAVRVDGPAQDAPQARDLLQRAAHALTVSAPGPRRNRAWAA